MHVCKYYIVYSNNSNTCNTEHISILPLNLNGIQGTIWWHDARSEWELVTILRSEHPNRTGEVIAGSNCTKTPGIDGLD